MQAPGRRSSQPLSFFCKGSQLNERVSAFHGEGVKFSHLWVALGTAPSLPEILESRWLLARVSNIEVEGSVN